MLTWSEVIKNCLSRWILTVGHRACKMLVWINWRASEECSDLVTCAFFPFLTSKSQEIVPQWRPSPSNCAPILKVSLPKHSKRNLPRIWTMWPTSGRYLPQVGILTITPTGSRTTCYYIIDIFMTHSILDNICWWGRPISSLSDQLINRPEDVFKCLSERL